MAYPSGLTKEEGWQYERARREAEREQRENTNPDGSPRTTYIAGPWRALLDALVEVAHLRAQAKSPHSDDDAPAGSI